MRTKKNKFIPVIVAGLIFSGTTAFGAGPSVESGHAQGAAANSAPAARPATPVAPSANTNNGGQAQPGNPTPLANTAPGRTITPSNAGNAGNTNAPGSTAEHRSDEPNHNSNRNSQNFNYGYPGYYYGDVWAPYNWYDNNSNANYPEFTYDNSAGTASNGTSANTTGSNPSGQTALPVNPPQAQQGQTSAGAAAQATNAVDKSPEMIAANNAVASAQAAYTSERERVLASLNDKPEFKEALARKHAAADQMKQAKAEHESQPAVVDLAETTMDAGDEVTRMREQAVATDPAAAQAKSKLNSAIADRDALRAKLMAQHG